MMSIWLELALIVGLILLNGLFALAELAIVSSRRVRLQQMEEAGSKGAAQAIALADDPGRFLSAVQVGITLIGIGTGAFGGATLGGRLGPVLDQLPGVAPRGGEIAFVLVVIGITALSVVIGELVPKQIALARPEPIAALAARPVEIFATVFRPFVWLLERSTAGILGLLRIPMRRGAPDTTEEEVKIAIAEGMQAGVIDVAEQEMIHGVLALADRSVAAVMTPRPDVYWVDLDDEPDVVAREIADCPYSVVVVARGGDIGSPLGVVQKKDLVGDLLLGHGLQIERQMRDPIYVPESISVMRMLEMFRTSLTHVAFVVDEYGDFLGVATLTDILEAIAGELPENHTPAEDEIIGRPDGTWLVDGRAPIDHLVEKLRLPAIDAEFHTAAGLALEKMARIPKEGETFEFGGWTIEVLDMDGKRIDKLLFTPHANLRAAE